MSNIQAYFNSPASTRKNKDKEAKPSSNEKQNKANAVDANKEESTIPWVEKYRPKKVDEVVCQEEAVAVLKRCAEGADLPNLLFHGPPGTGKTSSAVALCHQLFRTPQVYKDRVLELNASDERGIDVVRNRIKDFSRIAISKMAKDAQVPLKIVILDEADAMTGAAQSALRRTMESETQTTRFFLICNYITRIIEPLTSRCAKFRFKPLSAHTQKERLLMIAQKEGVEFGDDSAINRLVAISDGDLRKSITLLQSMACFGRAITVEDVLEMSGQVPKVALDSLVGTVRSQDHAKICTFVKSLVKQGYNANQLISQLADEVLDDEALQPKHKAKLLEKFAESERQLLEGAEEYLQLLNLMLAFKECLMETEE